jgi:hypothetical protein
MSMGFLSTWVSLHACEVKTARGVVRAQSSNAVFFVHSEDDDEASRALWKEVGASVVVHDPQKHGPSLIPWARCGRAVSRLPFLASIDYYWVRAPQVGSGGTLWYFCFFGVAVELGHSVMRAS